MAYHGRGLRNEVPYLAGLRQNRARYNKIKKPIGEKSDRLLGKQFTATAVMMLVKDGKLGLDDKIPRYFKGAPETWKEITVRHLLTHTAGMTDYPQDFDLRRDYTEDELLNRVMQIPLASTPGEKWRYSNLGYVTLGILIGKVTGKFYGDFLRERIFQPLGMEATRIINEADIIPNRSNGYRLIKGELKNQEWVSSTMNSTADGSLYVTVVDLVKWDAALYTEKLLSKAGLDLMWTPVQLSNGKTHPYGFGWALSEIGNHRVIEHGGAWQGFTTHIARYVSDQLTVIVLANLAGANPEQIARGIAGFYNAELRPVERKEIPLDPNILDTYVGQYEISPTLSLTVSREGTRLMVQATGQPKFEMFAESETKFFLKAADALGTFVKDENGKVTRLILHQGDITEAKKIK